MSVEEKIRMMEIVAEENRGRVRITPGVGSSHPAESICLAQKAKELGCDGVVVAPPFFYPLSHDENRNREHHKFDLIAGQRSHRAQVRHRRMKWGLPVYGGFRNHF
jgi:hypothetical protein